MSDQGPKLKKKNMLHSENHEILNAYKYKYIKEFSFYQAKISLD